TKKFLVTNDKFDITQVTCVRLLNGQTYIILFHIGQQIQPYLVHLTIEPWHEDHTRQSTYDAQNRTNNRT
uniref:Uncharacterized protein n=1 Tax=Romanomermis culicivorax TaxID=13658 RepID=A0A915JGC2_ROMCU